MTHTSDRSILSDFNDYLQEAVKKAVGEAFDEAIEQAVEDAKARRDETIAKTTLRLMSWVKFEDMGSTLRIEVEKPKDD